MKNQKNKKGLIIGIIALIVLVAVFVGAWMALKPHTSQGAKKVILQVVSMEGTTTEYVVQTDAEYLRQVMDEAEGLTYDGTEDSYGFMVLTVNGETADYSVDGSYWAFYINGDYCNYGVSEQPVADGDVFSIEYTKG